MRSSPLITPTIIVFLFSAFIISTHARLSDITTATNWCDSIPWIRPTCTNMPNDGRYAALSDVHFPEIIKCSCDKGSMSSRQHRDLGSLQRCSVAPTCNPSFCGTQLCIECVDPQKCAQVGRKITVQLSDACPRIHPQNVDNCVNNQNFADRNRRLGWCNCIRPDAGNIDLGCGVYAELVGTNPSTAAGKARTIELSPLAVRVTAGACGGSASPVARPVPRPVPRPAPRPAPRPSAPPAGRPSPASGCSTRLLPQFSNQYWIELANNNFGSVSVRCGNGRTFPCSSRDGKWVCKAETGCPGPLSAVTNRGTCSVSGAPRALADEELDAAASDNTNTNTDSSAQKSQTASSPVAVVMTVVLAVCALALIGAVVALSVKLSKKSEQRN